MRRIKPFRSAAVLCFHSVATSRLGSASATHVSYAELLQITRAVRLVAQIVPLPELLARHRSGRTTAGLVAFTFDDAYHALLDIAEDYFGREGVPATVFVTSSAANQGSRFWWDRLEEAVVRAPASRWLAFQVACGVPQSFLDGQPPEHGPLRPIRQWLLRDHQGRWPDHLESLLVELEQELAATTLHRSMSFAELERLASLPGFDIAVHTRTHALLPLLSDADFQQEVAGCYRELRDRFESARPLLAIPFGLFDRETGQRARAAGMQAAFTLAGRTWRGQSADSMTLPRLCVMRGNRRWKLLVRILGLYELLRREKDDGYPALPSERT